ncbi:uncharacterized protein TNCV_3970771 [Trichonephila clavipes]|nr:uncharacterized protein TNCV_3970771 [Trichonephila clavipes]
MQYQTRIRNYACRFCNLLTSIADYSNVCAKNVHGCADLCEGASSSWYHMRDKSRKETSSSKKSANGPDKISVYYSDVKGPSKYSGSIKVLFHTPHHTFTDQRTWWRFGRIRCGFSRDQ